jgi:hypothetical protein
MSSPVSLECRAVILDDVQGQRDEFLPCQISFKNDFRPRVEHYQVKP